MDGIEVYLTMWYAHLCICAYVHRDVEEMSDYVETVAHMPVVCLLVQTSLNKYAPRVSGSFPLHTSKRRPWELNPSFRLRLVLHGQANISVFAPLLSACRHLAVVGINTTLTNKDFLVLHTQGAFGTDAQTVSCADLLAVRCETKPQVHFRPPTVLLDDMRLDLTAVLSTTLFSKVGLVAALFTSVAALNGKPAASRRPPVPLLLRTSALDDVDCDETAKSPSPPNIRILHRRSCWRLARTAWRP
jgi:hypothetical protein